MSTLFFSAALGPALLAALLLATRSVRLLPESRYLAGLLMVLALLFANVISLDMRGRNLVPHLGVMGGFVVAGLLWRLSLVSRESPFSPGRQSLEALILLALPVLASWRLGEHAGIAVLLMQVAALSCWRWGSHLARAFFGRTPGRIESGVKGWVAGASLAISFLVGLAALQTMSEQWPVPAMASGLIPVIPALLALITSGLVLALAWTRARRPRRPARPQLSESEARAVEVQLHSTVVDRALFREPALQMLDVVTATGLPPESLREAVRRSGAAHFFDYVNRARIDAACEALAETDAPVSEILLAVGFNSSSSFYSEFRKRVGRPPTEFRRSARDRSDPERITVESRLSKS